MHVEVLVTDGSNLDRLLAVRAFQGTSVTELLCISVVLRLDL